jgi:3-deoxy-D-arabino-heptulosonate 7-phosphate (DAHP) synthase class II
MARPKKQKEEVTEDQVYYVASISPIEPEMEVYPELTADAAINYVKENDPHMTEIHLYEIKLIGKYKVKYNLEKIK